MSKNVSRVFFALWPTDAERASIAAWQAPLRDLCGGSPIPAYNLHNTLVFLGNVENERLEALKLVAQEVSGSGFRLEFDVARYWGHNHIVYAAPAEVPSQLMQLVDALERGLRRHRFEFDHRCYKPHITLLRHAQWTDKPLPVMPPVVWESAEFVLLKSVQVAHGVGYEVLESFYI